MSAWDEPTPAFSNGTDFEMKVSKMSSSGSFHHMPDPYKSEATPQVRVVIHHDWWAESPDIDGWTAAGDTYDELMQMIREGVAFALNRKVGETTIIFTEDREAWDARMADATPEEVKAEFGITDWRRLVDGMPPKPFADQHPLAEVLERMAVLDEYDGSGEKRLYAINLARIITVAEAQVGDGWKADPDRVVLTEEFNESGWLGLLLYMIANYEGRILWAEIGNNAAAWLRELTEGGAA